MEKMKESWDDLDIKAKISYTLAIVSFILSVMFGWAGFLVSPIGELSDSVLYLIAQFLLFCSSVFGLTAFVSRQNNKVD